MSTHLPFDIQVQIVKRLPIKSLIRFRSVCKSWKSFIDCSEFIAGYSFRHIQSQHLVVRYQVGSWRDPEVKYVSFVDDDTFPHQKFALTVPSLLQAKPTTIIGSSHGLLCLTGYFQEPDDSSRTRMAFLWNPAIRKSIVVVVPNVVHPSFDYVIGFGVCPHTKDPKLVRITYIVDYREMESISCMPSQVMVFTLSSREWTTSSCINLPGKSIGFTWSQTVIGRFIYWLAYDWIDVGESRNLIMSFDMITQEFKEIDLPDSLAKMCEEEDLSLYRVRESLAVVEYGRVVYGRGLWKGVCSIWMMDHGDSKAFTKLFTVNLPNASISQILGFRMSGEPIVEMRGGNALVLYEPCSKHIKDLGIHGNRYSLFGGSYMESLLLLDHEDGHIVKC